MENNNNLTAFPRPRSGCHHCFGRGFEGRWADTKTGVLCRCVINGVGRLDPKDPANSSKLLRENELNEIIGEKLW